ncbi:hypothetical protein Trydic_g19591 [Trypoxylus dichotomus]
MSARLRLGEQAVADKREGWGEGETGDSEIPVIPRSGDVADHPSDTRPPPCADFKPRSNRELDYWHLWNVSKNVHHDMASRWCSRGVVKESYLNEMMVQQVAM